MIAVFISFVIGSGIGQGYEDVCSLGADMNLNSTIINGAWKYEWIDVNNDYKPWWNHTLYQNIWIDWGKLYTDMNLIGNFFRNKYVIIEVNLPEVVVLAYCELTHTHPYNCDNNWVVYDDISSSNTDFFVKNCSYFTDENNCVNTSYLSSIGMSNQVDEYCIDDTVYEYNKGNYEYIGCLDGLPYYENIHNGNGSYLHFEWYLGSWVISLFPESSYSIITATCLDWNINECNDNFYEYNVYSDLWYENPNVDFDSCGIQFNQSNSNTIATPVATMYTTTLATTLAPTLTTTIPKRTTITIASTTSTIITTLEKSANSKSNNNGNIVSFEQLLIAALILVIISLVVYLICNKRRKQQKNRELEAPNRNENENENETTIKDRNTNTKTKTDGNNSNNSPTQSDGEHPQQQQQEEKKINAENNPIIQSQLNVANNNQVSHQNNVNFGYIPDFAESANVQGDVSNNNNNNNNNNDNDKVGLYVGYEHSNDNLGEKSMSSSSNGVAEVLRREMKSWKRSISDSLQRNINININNKKTTEEIQTYIIDGEKRNDEIISHIQSRQLKQENKNKISTGETVNIVITPDDNNTNLNLTSIGNTTEITINGAVSEAGLEAEAGGGVVGEPTALMSFPSKSLSIATTNKSDDSYDIHDLSPRSTNDPPIATDMLHKDGE